MCDGDVAPHASMSTRLDTGTTGCYSSGVDESTLAKPIDQNWIQSTAARVVARIASYAKPVLDVCGQPCWKDGPPCELAPGHPSAHTSTQPFTRPQFRFGGMIPSSRPNQPPYHVTLAIDSDDATCTCAAFTRWNRGGDCSHIKLIREAYRV